VHKVKIVSFEECPVEFPAKLPPSTMATPATYVEEGKNQKKTGYILSLPTFIRAMWCQQEQSDNQCSPCFLIHFF
jgi:hypothetical protein